MCTVDVFSFLFLDDKDSCLYRQMFGDNKNNNCFTDRYFTYIKFQVLLNNFSCLHVFFLKIIGDRRKSPENMNLVRDFIPLHRRKGLILLLILGGSSDHTRSRSHLNNLVLRRFLRIGNFITLMTMNLR